MSKDGDWILREDIETAKHVLGILSQYGARYRFGAPLDVRWLSGGWSSHFEFKHDKLRVRTDFFTRPPRLSDTALEKVWKQEEEQEIPFIGLVELAEMKKTRREKDYAVIGELARRMEDPRDRLLYSRGARDLVSIAGDHPDVVRDLVALRPLLKKTTEGRDHLEKALDAERRSLIHADEKRLECYMGCAEPWASAWPAVAKEIAGCPLEEAHSRIIDRARGLLPFDVSGDTDETADAR